MKALQYIFVHGLCGWGSYDPAYKRMPYWGMRGGDLLVRLAAEGRECRAASVAPTGSAWDRACELYAQLAGLRTDYGASHSARMGHERFGPDYTGRPLIPDFGPDSRLVLLGHSVGGATVRLFSELMARGDARERQETSGGLSPLFAGGMGERLQTVVALASPMNGTTAYDLFEDPSFDAEAVKTPLWSGPLARMMAWGTSPRRDGRSTDDYADYDMRLDSARELNARLPELQHVFYISVPCCFTEAQADGTQRPRKGMEPLFVRRSTQIGAYEGTTRGGMAVGKEWRANDGLVNTVSAEAPLGSPRVPYDPDRLQRGVWNVQPAVCGDHMYLQGGLTKKHEIFGFYRQLLEEIRRAADGAV